MQGPECREVMPRGVSGVFSARLLAALGCAVTLVLADLVAYGPVASGPAAYTHTVGPVFNRAADERKSPEQLCRYITRPALADQRVQCNAAGKWC